MHFVEHLRRQEFFCEGDEEWQFSDGSSAALCINSAILVAKQFSGVVQGYYSVDNPSATIGLPVLEGHDFALIGNRWLTDYWAWYVDRIIATPILDLKYQEELAIAQRLYGSTRKWDLVHSFTNTINHE